MKVEGKTGAGHDVAGSGKIVPFPDAETFQIQTYECGRSS